MTYKAFSNRIKQLFQDNQRPKLSPYITAGFPSKELTVPLMHQMVAAGATVIELGIPFSDPMAEGVTIQQAMEVALENGTTVSDVFEMVRQFRQTDQQTAIVLMGYLNPIEIIGAEAFAKQAGAAGVDGTIIVDLPPEEAANYFPLWQANQLDFILLCSPTTSPERMKLICQLASGYVYYVSLKGVTGSKALDVDYVRQCYQARKSYLADMPLLVGFGIKTADDASQLAQFADGIVIGAALIETINKAQDPCQAVYEFLQPIARALS